MTANYRQNGANRDTERDAQTDDNTGDVTREEWIESFREGFKLGRAGRKLEPEKRHSDVSDVHLGGESSDALQQGYVLGKNKGYPGAEIDVEKKANAAFDRSEHSADLTEWS